MSNEKYPINLLIAIGNSVPKKITPDIRSGIEYASSDGVDLYLELPQYSTYLVKLSKI